MITKRNKINQIKAGAVLSYISMGLGYIISIVFTPIMLRLLGQNEFGLYNLVSSVVSYLGLLSFGFGSAYVRYYSIYKIKNDEQKIRSLNGMFLTVFSIIGFVAIVAGMILVNNVKIVFGNKLSSDELETAKILMAIMIINISLSFPTSVFNSFITAKEEYIVQKVLQMIKLIIGPFVMLPVLLMGYRSIGMVIVTTSVSISVEIINVFFCIKKLRMRFSFKKFDFILMKDIAVFSSYIFINMIIDQINWNVDKFIIGRFRGTVGVAVYGLASQLNTYYMSLSTTVSNVFIPRINRMVIEANNDDLTDLFIKIGRIQFFILSFIGTGFLFFGRPFINKWAGSDYSDSYYIALILIIPGTISLIQSIGIEIQRAKNLHKFRTWVYFIIAIFNLIISIPLTKTYGGIGAAIGTSIVIVLGNGLIMNCYYNVKVGINIKLFWAKILDVFPSLFLPIIIGIILNCFVDLYNIFNFLLSGAVYVIIFFISLWLLGMNCFEKNLFRKPIKRIMGKVV